MKNGMGFIPSFENPLSQYKFLLMMKNVNESCQNISANDNSICLCVKSDMYQAVVWTRLYEDCVEFFLERN